MFQVLFPLSVWEMEEAMPGVGPGTGEQKKEDFFETQIRSTLCMTQHLMSKFGPYQKEHKRLITMSNNPKIHW